MPPQDDETTLRRYVLGVLTDDERDAVERACLEPGDALDRLLAVEDDLIDDYLSGRLEANERGRFQRHYLTVPRHRTRVAEARALRGGRPDASAESRERGAGWWAATSAAVRAWPPLAQVAVAAALVFTATTAAWVIGWGSGRIMVALAPPSPVSAVPPTPLPHEPAPPVPGAPPPQSRPTAPAILALSISPVHVRGAQKPAALVITPGIDIVRLQLQGEPGEPHPARARTIVRTVAGQEVWRGPAYSVAGSEPQVFARIDVPAARIPPDDYVVELFQTDSGAGEVERYRYFVRVGRQPRK